MKLKDKRDIVKTAKAPCGKVIPDITPILKQRRDIRRLQDLLNKVDGGEPLSLGDRIDISCLLAAKITSLQPQKKGRKPGKTKEATQRDIDIYLKYKEMHTYRGGSDSAVTALYGSTV